ncbi:MAG: hypothetical protein ACRD16_15645 [Thermoanaerobaculia bacterium]
MRDFWSGLSVSVRRPHFAIAVWLVEAALAAVLALPISNFLHAELNHSLQRDRMIASPDLAWWQAERREHPDLAGNFPEAALSLLSPNGAAGLSSFTGTKGIAAAFLGLGTLAIVLHAFLLGGIFGSLHDDQGNNLTIFAREGARRLPAFLIITLLAASLCAGLYHSVYYLSGRALRTFSGNLPAEGKALAFVALRVAALAVCLTLVKIAADAIRVALVERPDLPPVTRYIVGIGSALGRLPSIVATLAFATLATGLLFFLWSRLSVNSAATTTGGVVLLVAAQQVFVFLRSIVKVGYYAGLRTAILRRSGDAPSPPPPGSRSEE